MATTLPTRSPGSPPSRANSPVLPSQDHPAQDDREEPVFAGRTGATRPITEDRVSPTPTGRARTFASDDLIVSKTDPQGRITYANDVFLRVSGYTAEEVVGQPHNIIRHPHFPRGVFKLLWDTVNAKQEIFAYVANMTKHGDTYWVLAHVTPSLDASGRIVGHHSWRRRPEPAAVREVDAVYDLMRAEEARHSRTVDAAEASLALVARVLAEQGVSYDEFVWDLIARTTSLTR